MAGVPFHLRHAGHDPVESGDEGAAGRAQVGQLGVHSRRRQKLVDARQEMTGILQHLSERPHQLAPGGRLGVFEQHLPVAEDVVERRA